MVRRVKKFISSRIRQSYWGRIEKEYGGNILSNINSGDEHRLYYAVTPVHHLKFIEKYLKKLE